MSSTNGSEGGMTEENRWHLGIVSGIGLCAFWGQRDAIHSGWTVENVTCIIINPQTFQPGLLKWTPFAANMIDGSMHFEEGSVTAMADPSKELIEKVSALWSGENVPNIIIPTAKKADGFRLV